MGPVITAAGLLLVCVALCTILILRFVYTEGRRRPAIIATCMVTFSVLFTLYALEVASRIFIRSDAFIQTLAGRRWMDKYYHPVNSLGYRDVEHEDPAGTGRRLALVIGDSFVAGHGIADYRDRFANVLGDSLGPAWDVAIAARGGYSPPQELRALRTYPFTPEVVVLSYFINDIDGAIGELGAMPDIQPEPAPPYLRPIVDRSFLVNTLYWRLVRGWSGMSQKYWQLISDGYSDPRTWATHTGQLQSIIDHTRERGIELIVVVFPDLTLMDETAAFTSKVRDYLLAEGVPVLDMYEHLRGRPRRSLVVNPLDAHPNEQVNRETASLLFNMFKERGLLD